MPPSEDSVEVVYARPDRQRVVTVVLRSGMSAWDAVEVSGLLQEFPEIDRQALVLGIYGRRVDRAQLLRAGDRVEIYRPLRFDPRDARRRAVRSARSAARGGG